MREVRGCSPCLLGFTQLCHNTTPFELEYLLILRAVIIICENHEFRNNKFKMRVSTDGSRNFRRRTGKTEELNYKSCSVHFHRRQEKNWTPKTTNLTRRPTDPTCHPTNFTKRAQVIWNSPVRADTKFRSFQSLMAKWEKRNFVVFEANKRFIKSNLFWGLNLQYLLM